MLRALGTLAPFALVGCLANTGDEGMFIVNNTAVTGTTCTLTGMTGQPFTAAGIIAAGSPSGYFFTPLIESRITADLTMADQVEQRTITLEGAHISLSATGATGQSVAIAEPNYDALFAATVPPLGDVNVGFELISKATIASFGTTMPAEIEARVIIYGKMGGGDLTGTPFTYPVTICEDCVVNILPGGCGVAAAATNLGDPCNVFQDGVVDCCSNPDNTVTCPSPAPS